MNKIKNIFIGTLIIFLLSFFTHNIYTIFPNFITSIFFPVNESIWEHTKMILITWIIFSPLQYFYLKKYNYKNIVTSIFISLLTNIILLLITFTPIYFLMNKQDNLLFTLFIYLITIFISMYINEYIISNRIVRFNKLSLLITFLLLTIYGIFTYYPLKLPIFFDYSKGIYSIEKS